MLRTKEEILEDIQLIKDGIAYHEREASIRKNDLHWLNKELQLLEEGE